MDNPTFIFKKAKAAREFNHWSEGRQVVQMLATEYKKRESEKHSFV